MRCAITLLTVWPAIFIWQAGNGVLMKIRFAVLFLAMGSLASAQSTPAAPALHMGLWQSEVTVEISGMSGGTGAPRRIVKQSCMKRDSWKKALEQMQNQRQQVSCTTSNLQQDEHHVSFDESCTAEHNVTSTMHIAMELDSKEAMHGTTSVNISGPDVPQGISIKSTIRSKFLKSDCGALKPGEQQDAPPTAY